MDHSTTPGRRKRDRVVQVDRTKKRTVQRNRKRSLRKAKMEEYPGKVGETVAAVTISAVVVWNIVIHPEVMKREDLVKHLHPWVSSLNLNQHWNMFAPVPYYNDWWLIGMGLDWKGGILNLWSGETMPEELRPPVDGGKYYGSYRLRKSLHLAHRFDKMEDMLGYYCNTGKWQGLAIWTVWRRNLGTSATTSQPYLKEREWWWKCDGSNEQAVQEFYDEVLYRMEMGDRARGTNARSRIEKYSRIRGINGGKEKCITADIRQNVKTGNRRKPGEQEMKTMAKVVSAMALLMVTWNWSRMPKRRVETQRLQNHR